jgi:pyruvoyl-dependent arginine decarboxylase (PvlArgDC)
MSGPILAKTSRLPADDILRAKGAVIEHHLYGNESQVRPLAKALAAQGWQTSVEPQNEVGWTAKLIESPSAFRTEAVPRIRDLCTIAAKNNVRYRAWWVDAPGIADHVSQ